MPVAGTYDVIENDEVVTKNYENNVYYKLVDGTSRIAFIFVEVDGETLTGANGVI